MKYPVPPNRSSSNTDRQTELGFNQWSEYRPHNTDYWEQIEHSNSLDISGLKRLLSLYSFRSRCHRTRNLKLTTLYWRFGGHVFCSFRISPLFIPLHTIPLFWFWIFHLIPYFHTHSVFSSCLFISTHSKYFPCVCCFQCLHHFVCHKDMYVYPVYAFPSESWIYYVYIF